MVAGYLNGHLGRSADGYEGVHMEALGRVAETHKMTDIRLGHTNQATQAASLI